MIDMPRASRCCRVEEREMSEEKRRRDLAAARLQGFVRGHLTRAGLKYTRAAIFIQRATREFLARQRRKAIEKRIVFSFSVQQCATWTATALGSAIAKVMQRQLGAQPIIHKFWKAIALRLHVHRRLQHRAIKVPHRQSKRFQLALTSNDGCRGR